MAWTDIPDKSTGDLMDETWYDDHFKGNLEFLYGPPAARVYNSANISISHSATTALTFDSERYDTDDLHSTSSNTGRLTAPVDGKYLITGHIRWDSSGYGERQLVIKANGTYIARTNADSTSNAEQMSVATVYELSAGDYVTLGVFQSSGGALNVLAEGNHSPEFAMHWLGD
jgi:hypothetical protein